MFLNIFFIWIIFGVSILAASNNQYLDGLRHKPDLSCFVPFVKKGEIKKEVKMEEIQENISPLTISSFESPVISPNTAIAISLQRLQEAAELEEIESLDKKIKKRRHSPEKDTKENNFLGWVDRLLISDPLSKEAYLEEQQALKKARKDL
ncbi:MAG: hypothetical protein ACXWL2_02640 [Candidatus Chromulinivorax sp.]